MQNLNINHSIYEEKAAMQLFANRFTNDLDDANDLVQDTFLKAIRYASMYKEGTNLRGWLYTIMKNTFINDYRRTTKRNAMIETSEDLSSYQLYNSASTNAAENTFVSNDIDKAMSKLSKDCYIPFSMYFEGFKYHEIADELEIPIGTVKTRIHEARKVLKKNLKIYNLKQN